MKLEEFRVYQLSIVLAEKIWNIVMKWDYFAKDTVGKQLVRSADSVAANLSEGFGRFHYKDTKNFSYYARGSLYETKTWIVKASNRNLIDQKNADEMILRIDSIGVKLNNYIKSIGETTKK